MLSRKLDAENVQVLHHFEGSANLSLFLVNYAMIYSGFDTFHSKRKSILTDSYLMRAVTLFFRVCPRRFHWELLSTNNNYLNNFQKICFRVSVFFSKNHNLSPLISFLTYQAVFFSSRRILLGKDMIHTIVARWFYPTDSCIYTIFWWKCIYAIFSKNEPNPWDLGQTPCTEFMINIFFHERTRRNEENADWYVKKDKSGLNYDFLKKRLKIVKIGLYHFGT